MKKVFSIFAIALILASCSNKQAKEEQAAKLVAIKVVKDSLKLDSFKKVEAVKKQAQAQLAQQEQARKDKQTLLLSQEREARAVSSNSGANTQAAAPAKKKGWSQAAKGTVIGGVAGAVGGALIDKRHGQGAIIGGVAGAGAGYLIGRGQDRKSGRVKPKN